MKYMMFMKHSENFRAATVPPALMEAMGTFVRDAMAKGILVETAGLQPSKSGVRLKLSGGKLKVIDGPFTESKEIVGGFAIVETKTRQEALDLAMEFMELHRVHWPAFEGESEVRPYEEYTPQ